MILNLSSLTNSFETINNGRDVVFSGNAEIKSGGNLNIVSLGNIENTKSKISSSRDLNFTSLNGSLLNQSSTISAGENLNLITQNDIKNINSAVSANGDVNLTSLNGNFRNDLSNLSAADGDMNITANNITNYRSNIASGNDLSLVAIDDIKNIGANIIAINNLKLTSLSVNILNSAIVQTNDANLLASNSDSYQLAKGDYARSSGNIRSTLLQTAAITGGNVEINAAKDFTNLAANISTSKNILSDGSTADGN